MVKKEVKINKPKKIFKVTTELNFNGNLKDLKDFLIKNENCFIKPEIREVKRYIPLPIRKDVIYRSEGLCQICGDIGKEIDHIIPFCAGGRHSLDNLRLLCIKCHRKTFSDFGKIKIKVNNYNNKKDVFIS